MISANGKSFVDIQTYKAQLPVELMEFQNVVDDGKDLPDADDPIWKQEGLGSFEFEYEEEVKVEIDYEKLPEAVDQLNKNLLEVLAKVIVYGVVIIGIIHLANVSQLKVRTLQIWYTERPWLFDAVLEKASRIDG